MNLIKVINNKGFEQFLKDLKNFKISNKTI